MSFVGASIDQYPEEPASKLQSFSNVKLNRIFILSISYSSEILYTLVEAHL